MLMIAPKVCLDGYYSVDYWVTGVFLSSLLIALILRRWNPFLNEPMIFTRKLCVLSCIGLRVLGPWHRGAILYQDFHTQSSADLCTRKPKHTAQHMDYGQNQKTWPPQNAQAEDGPLDHSTQLSWLHVVLTLLLIKLALLLCCCIRVLLVLGDQVIHVGFSLCELHLVHTLTGVPVKECLTAEHCSEELSHTLEHLLDCGGVAEEGNGHLQALWWNVAHGCLDVVWDPFNKVRRVLVLHVQHLLVNFLGGHATTEERCSSQVTAVARISSAHHVLGIEHLLGQLRNSQCTVLLRPTRSQWCKTGHEEVKTWERNQVHCNLTQIAIQLPRETDASCHTTDGRADQVIQIAVGGCREFQCAEANVIQSLVVKQHAFIGILDQLVERQDSIVWLDNSVRDLWGWDDGKSLHDAVRVFLTNLGDEEGTHTRSSASTKRVAELETLQAITAFCFLAHHIKH